eukprot:Skav207589  [mRNA]  locus=scaffold2450:64500:65174:+ [translate_table: standard]
MLACCCSHDVKDEVMTVTAQHPSDTKSESIEKIQPTLGVLPPSKSAKPPTNLPGSFQVVVPTKDFSTLGVYIDALDENLPLIAEINEGAIRKFNDDHPDSRIQLYDVLMTVDETVAWEAIEPKLDGPLPEEMTLLLKRPKKVQVSFEKTGPMGVKLDFKKNSCGALVQELRPSGLIATWNSQHPSDAIAVGDRVIEFDGQTYQGGELLERMKKENFIKLTVLKY